MPLSNQELGDYIASLERLLQGNPAGQTAALTGYLHKLEAFAGTGNDEAIEKTLQLLGTAVGSRSMMHIFSNATSADHVQRDGRAHIETAASLHTLFADCLLFAVKIPQRSNS
jgi:hypothetical protein